MIRNIYDLMEEKRTYPSPDFGSFLAGLFIGLVFIGPFVWTPLGRSLTIKAVSKAYKVAESEIKKRIEEVEKEERKAPPPPPPELYPSGY
jgi:hypothetical protein